MASAEENLIEILKEKYEYENERKLYYDDVISLPVTLLGFIVAGVYFIVNDENKVPWFENSKPFFIYPLILTTVVSMYFLYRVFFGLKRKYCSFPETTDVMKDYKNIKDYYANQAQNSQIQKNIDNDFNDFIIKWYTDINDNNIKVNDTRMNNFHYSKFSIGISYLLGILVFGLYCVTKINHKPMAKPATVQTPPPPPKPAPSPVRREKSDQPSKPAK